MIRISLTTNQLATARFAISPLLQLSSAVIRVRAPGVDAGPGLRARWRGLSPATRELLELLVDPATGYIPDFLNPYPTTDRPSLADELRVVRDTSLLRLREELGRYVRLGEVCPEYAEARGVSVAEADARRRPPTELERAAWEGEPRALTEPAADALAEGWSVLMEPVWDLSRTLLETDILHRVRQISSGGVQETVLELLDGGHWDGSVAEMTSAMTADITHRTGTMVLAPCVMLDASPPLSILCSPTPRDLYLGYPCRGRAAVTGPFATRFVPTADATGLADVVGATRRRVLEALVEAQSGRALSARLGLSAATVSYHLGRLHRGGLVHRRRVGKEVVYSLTEPARALSRPR